jgi:hypothetical protein
VRQQVHGFVKKIKPPAIPKRNCGRDKIEPLSFLFLLRGEGFLGGLRLGGALLELVHAARGVHELLLSRVQGMAHIANAHNNGGPGGTRLDHVAAGATDFRVIIFRMNVRSHKKDNKDTTKTPDDKGEFVPKSACRTRAGRNVLSARNIKQPNFVSLPFPPANEACQRPE